MNIKVLTTAILSAGAVVVFASSQIRQPKVNAAPIALKEVKKPPAKASEPTNVTIRYSVEALKFFGLQNRELVEILGQPSDLARSYDGAVYRWSYKGLRLDVLVKEDNRAQAIRVTWGKEYFDRPTPGEIADALGLTSAPSIKELDVSGVGRPGLCLTFPYKGKELRLKVRSARYTIAVQEVDFNRNKRVVRWKPNPDFDWHKGEMVELELGEEFRYPFWY